MKAAPGGGHNTDPGALTGTEVRPMRNVPVPVHHRPWCDHTACQLTGTGEGRHLGPASELIVPDGSVTVRLCEKVGKDIPAGLVTVQLQVIERREVPYPTESDEVVDECLVDVTTTAELTAGDAWRLGTLLRHRSADAQWIGGQR
jgi:hypothetical protein